MKPTMRFFQVGDGQMQIALGGGQSPVAEEFLDEAEVGPIAHEMRRAGVPPNVRRDFFLHSTEPGVLRHELIERGASERSRFQGYEEGRM